jgi:hypothetical protein
LPAYWRYWSPYLVAALAGLVGDIMAAAADLEAEAGEDLVAVVVDSAAVARQEGGNYGQA